MTKIGNMSAPEISCKGAAFSTHFHSEFPQPPQDPITLLTGHAHNVATGSACAGIDDYEVKYERTGD